MKNISFFFQKLLNNPLIKSSAIMFVGTMGTNVLSYLYHLLVGRILGPSRYGELAAMLSIFYILNSPSVVLQNILVKFFSTFKASNNLSQAKALYFTATKYIVGFTTIGLIVAFPFISIIANFLHINTPIYFIWLYLIFASMLLGMINTSALQAFQRFTLLSAMSNLGAMLRLVFGVALASMGVGWTLIAGVLSNIVGYLMVLPPLSFIFKAKSEKLSLSKGLAVKYSIPALISIFAITSIYSQDVVLVKHFFSSESAGIYSALSVLGKIIFFASSAVGIVAFPIIAERHELKKSNHSIIWLSVAAVASVSFALVIGFFLFPQLIVGLLFGHAFDLASKYLGLFGVFLAFFSLSNLLLTIYLAMGKTMVWIFAAFFSVTQIVLISFFHNSLQSVIINNIVVAAGLFTILLVYYPYAQRQS